MLYLLLILLFIHKGFCNVQLIRIWDVQSGNCVIEGAFVRNPGWPLSIEEYAGPLENCVLRANQNGKLYIEEASDAMIITILLGGEWMDHVNDLEAEDYFDTYTLSIAFPWNAYGKFSLYILSPCQTSTLQGIFQLLPSSGTTVCQNYLQSHLHTCDCFSHVDEMTYSLLYCTVYTRNVADVAANCAMRSCVNNPNDYSGCWCEPAEMEYKVLQFVEHGMYGIYERESDEYLHAIGSCQQFFDTDFQYEFPCDCLKWMPIEIAELYACKLDQSEDWAGQPTFAQVARACIFAPSNAPTQSQEPTPVTPITSPSVSPSKIPSIAPTYSFPSSQPSTLPSSAPTLTPSNSMPSENPTADPISPTIQPSAFPLFTDPSTSPQSSGPSTSPSDEPFLQAVAFDMDFSVVITDLDLFLQECSLALQPLQCIDAFPGSVIVFIRGDESLIYDKVECELADGGLQTSSFGTLPIKQEWLSNEWTPQGICITTSTQAVEDTTEESTDIIDTTTEESTDIIDTTTEEPTDISAEPSSGVTVTTSSRASIVTTSEADAVTASSAGGGGGGMGMLIAIAAISLLIPCILYYFFCGKKKDDDEDKLELEFKRSPTDIELPSNGSKRSPEVEPQKRTVVKTEEFYEYAGDTYDATITEDDQVVEPVMFRNETNLDDDVSEGEPDQVEGATDSVMALFEDPPTHEDKTKRVASGRMETRHSPRANEEHRKKRSPSVTSNQKRDPRNRRQQSDDDGPRKKRDPRNKSTYDEEVRHFIDYDPEMSNLREQVISLINKSKKFQDPSILKGWKEQIDFTKAKVRERLLNKFGYQRVKPYTDRLDDHWNELASARRKKAVTFDAHKFFDYFDVNSHGDLTMEEFTEICNLIEPTYDANECQQIFLFVDLTSRGSINEHDLHNFAAQHWGGKVGTFKNSIGEFLAITSKKEARKMLKTHSRKSPFFAGGSAFDDAPSSLFAAEDLAADDELISDSTATLLAKMAKLREDMENGRESGAFERTEDIFSGTPKLVEEPPKRKPGLTRKNSGGGDFESMYLFDDDEVNENTPLEDHDTVSSLFEEDDNMMDMSFLGLMNGDTGVGI